MFNLTFKFAGNWPFRRHSLINSLLLFCCLANAAQALEQYTFVTQWGNSITDGQFSAIGDIATDSQGNIYVADLQNDWIQKFDRNGRFLTKWDSFYGLENGIAIDSLDHIYVTEPQYGADPCLGSVQKFDKEGNFLMRWETKQCYIGSSNNAPRHIVVDSQDHIYVAGPNVALSNDIISFGSRIEKFDSTGNLLAEWNLVENNYVGMTSDFSDHIYIMTLTPSDDHVKGIHKFDGQGNLIAKLIIKHNDASYFDLINISSVYFDIDKEGYIYTITNSSSSSPTAGDAVYYIEKRDFTNNVIEKVIAPQGLYDVRLRMDRAGHIYLIDGNHIYKLDSQGNLLAKWGGNMRSAEGQFNQPVSIAIDSDNNLYVAEVQSRVQKFDHQGNFLLQFGKTARGNDNIVRGEGYFEIIVGITLDKDNNIYVSECHNGRIQKFDNNGDFLTQWMMDGDYFCTDFAQMAIDSKGTFYIPHPYPFELSRYNNTGDILDKRNLSPTCGPTSPSRAMTIDDNDNVYVVIVSMNCESDKPENFGLQLLKFPPNQDEYESLLLKAPNKTLNMEHLNVASVAIDQSGNIFVLVREYDGVNFASFVQKFDSSGNLLARWGGSGSGEGQFDHPSDIAIDKNGYVYVADTGNNRIQKFAPVVPTTNPNDPPATPPPATDSTPPPSDAPPVMESPCITEGITEQICNAAGRTVTNLTLKTNGSMSNFVLTGTLDNQGWLANFTVKPEGHVKGGILSGSVINEGTLENIDFRGSSIVGGTLIGNITNNSKIKGVIKDVRLLGAQIQGGILAGRIEGDRELSGRLEHLSIESGSHVSDVLLERNVKIAEGVSLTNVAMGDTTAKNLTLSGYMSATGTTHLLENVSFTAGTSLEYGRLTGTVKGDPESPALLTRVEIFGNSYLENLILGEHTRLHEGVTIGHNVKNACNANGLDINSPQSSQVFSCFTSEVHYTQDGEFSTVSMDITVEPTHVGKIAHFYAVIIEPPNAYFLKQDQWEVWNGEIATLQDIGFLEELYFPSLSTLQFGLAADVLNNFHGNVTLYMGYRLKDGTLIYNGTEPVKLTLPH